MNPLEALHKMIDESGWDYRDKSLINKKFQEVNEALQKLGLRDLLRNSEFERQVFAFNKGTTGLKPMTGGTKTLEDGSEIPFEWPDIKDFIQDDFTFISTRFDKCKNKFAKTEYGLFLYYSNFRRDNTFVCELLNYLVLLAQDYLDKSRPKDDNNHYIHDFNTVLDNALFIAENRKSVPEILEIYNSLILLVYDTHQNWDVTHQSTLRTAIDLTNYAIDYYKDFSTKIDVTNFFSKNWEAAKYLSNTYVWGAIYTVDISVRLCEKTKSDKTPWILFKAQQYEKLADEAEGTSRQLAAVSFVEKALRLYIELKDESNIKRLEKRYSEIRGTGEFMEIKEPFPSEFVQHLEATIKNEILEKDGKDLVLNFVYCPMFQSIDAITQAVENKKEQQLLSYYFGTSISDKFGNTIESFPGQSEEWSFIQSYGFQFQIGTHFLLRFFFEALKSGKLNAEVVLDYLRTTWYNDPIERNYNRNITKIIPLELLKPCICNLFENFNLLIKHPELQTEFVTVIDSIGLKVEAILRYFCEKLDIPTFKPKKFNIVMEKNIDDLLADLKHDPACDPPQVTNFDENDRWFIKFIMTEKAGENLRNRIAHGLLDIDEYSFEKAILPFTIIMRLSKYKFTSNPQ